ncbi:hypothetical protein ACLKA6_001801 [Drosophila palustris]
MPEGNSTPLFAMPKEERDTIISECLRTECDENNVSRPRRYTLQTYLDERRLINLVRRQPAIYNSRHAKFNDEGHKEELWQKIAQEMSLELNKCLSTWAELRYTYQRHVRRMRKYRRLAQFGPKPARLRPTMLHEEDLLFLHTHVSRLPRQWEKPTEAALLVDDDDDDDVTIVATPPADIIDLDVDFYDQYKITPEQQRLIDAVQPYSQLYDPQHPDYTNYRHRGLIWGAISNELREKATKLMKIWLQLQTRYEWELTYEKDDRSQLKEQLRFLEPHVPNIKDSVCKMSLYLQDTWFDPIEHFRNVMNLINVLKSLPELGQLVDDYQHCITKPVRYHELWIRVASQVNASYQRCEVTWLVLRHFYMELTEMRKVGYQLQDKWFFENIIGSLYKLIGARAARCCRKRLNSNSNVDSGSTAPKLTATNSEARQIRPPNFPLAIVYPPSTKPTSTTTMTTSSLQVGSMSTDSVTRTISGTSFTLPRITAAISVVPVPATTAVDQISTTNILSSQLGLAIPATVKLANVVGTSPVRKGLEQLSQPKTGGAIIRVVSPSKLTLAQDSLISMAPKKGNPTMPMMELLSPTPPSIALPSALPTAPSIIIPPPTAPPRAPLIAPLLPTSVPMPKLVPLTIRNDKVAVPSLATTAVHHKSCNSALSDLQSYAHNSNSITSHKKLAIVKPKNQKPNIKIEFRDCPINGRILSAKSRGTPSNLNMPKLAVFIREVLAIPQLHSKDTQLVNKIDDLWMQLAKKLHLRDNVCRAIWKFLANNMNLFPQIAPMGDLMRPFKTKLKVWEKSHRLFSKFDEIARKYLWMLHKHKLPALMQLFSKYEHLYADLRRPRPGESMAKPMRRYTEKEKQEVWRLARERFPLMNHRDVWSMFKFAFKTYMDDLERGIENPWPQNWWHALEQLKFLITVRYHPLEPYYYIVHNKFMEEVKRCSMYEALMDPTSEADAISTSGVETVRSPVPWETEEAKRLLVGELTQSVDVVASVMGELTTNHQDEDGQENDQNQDHEMEVLQNEQESELDRIQDRMEIDFMTNPQHPVAELAQILSNDHRTLPNMDAYELTRLLRNEPKAYGKATTEEKRIAWQGISKELKSSVSDCRLSLQYALREQRIWRIRDPSGRCQLSAKYFRHMTEVYKMVMGKISVPMEPEITDPVYPERYIPEINLVTFSQDLLRTRLEIIFAKYAQLANTEDCSPQVESNCINGDILSITDVTSSQNSDEPDT